MDEVTVIVPVEVEQSGCVTETRGVLGVPTNEFTVALAPEEVQPEAFCAVTWYVAFAVKPVNTPDVLV